ncbi:MAG: hypothetical protein QS721_10420 [Candidatus Endonucleobacter sp. (ex Gigantidas childressi)]|nr:hypothetical protein [Candidatus Endonucleobacter sp. (ex Gigantidas childressi)]
MDTNAQNTMVIIYQHVEIFFSMLDNYGNTKNNDSSFPLAAYQAVISAYIKREDLSKQDENRINNALSISNLQDCCLISFYDEASGQFELKKHIIDGIRNLDSRRIRELGQPDLDNIYLQLKTVHDYFIPQSGLYDKESYEFAENMATLKDILQDSLTKMDHNVRALEGSSKRLADILDDHDFNMMVVTDQVSSALKEVIRISKRNIRPTLIFLNERSMTSDSSAMRLIRELKEQFQKDGLYKVATNVGNIEMKLLSYSQVILETRRRMNRYVEMNRKSRALYNAIEKKWNELYGLVVDRLDTKLTGKHVPAGHPVFDPAKEFLGITTWTSTSAGLIEMPEYAGTEYRDEYIRDQLEQVEAIKTKKRKLGKQRLTTQERIKDKKHLEKLIKVMGSYAIDEFKPDLYFAVHTYLKSKLPGYMLTDLFEGVNLITITNKDKSEDQIRLDKGIYVVPTLSRGEIIHNKQKLSYVVRKQVQQS